MDSSFDSNDFFQLNKNQVEDFDGPRAPAAFGALHKSKASIIGPTAVKELSARKLRPTFCDRPLFSHAMQGMGICFNRYKNKVCSLTLTACQSMVEAAYSDHFGTEINS
jgi:hypothetical protein